MRSYLDPDLSPEQRIEYAFYALFVVEAWYSDLREEQEKYRVDEGVYRNSEYRRLGVNAKQYKALTQEQKRRRTGDEPPPAPPTKPPSVASQCLTRTAAVGIALNAWYLLAYTGLLCTDDLRATIPYAPRFLTEQAAEKVFRAVRAVLGGENFTLADFFRRFDRFMALGILRATHEGELAFPDHGCAYRWDETRPTDFSESRLPAGLTTTSLTTAVGAAKLAAIADLLAVGINVHRLRIHHLDVPAADKDAPLADLDDEPLVPPSEGVTFPIPSRRVKGTCATSLLLPHRQRYLPHTHSKDRSLRVQTMSRFVAVWSDEMREHCTADPEK